MKKKSTTLPPETVQFLKDWMMSPEHVAHPYPTEAEKREIMEATGIELKQLTNWFVNNRKRYWKPRVEARLQVQRDGKPNVIKRDGSLLSLADSDLSTVNTPSSPPPSMRPKRTANTSPVVSRPRRLSTTESESGDSIASPPMIIEQGSMEEGVVVVSSDDEDPVVKIEHRTELIDVHILRPAHGGMPDLADVSVLRDIPDHRCLRTYRDCPMQYSFSDPSNASTRRDAEISRLKKQYLSVYLIGQQGEPVPLSPAPKKRKVTVIPETPRPHFRRFSVELWKEACGQAQDPHDDELLPSLEEAATLFGFAK